jgi:hypothetical protein
MPSLSLEATLYLVHHIVLPPKLPQTDDWKVEFEDALLDTTVEALQTFGKVVRNEQPQVSRYAGRSRSFWVIFIEGIQEHFRPPLCPAFSHCRPSRLH